MASSRYLVGPSDGETIWEGPVGTVVKASSASTGGLLSICEMPVAAGFMIPPHTHRDTDEWSYVLDGRIGARIGDDEFTADAGSWILKPRGIMHTFWNAGPAPARIIELLTPGRFEEFFRREAAIAETGDLTDEAMESLAALAEEFGTTPDMTWVDELAARYGLQMTY